jgi:hypothetical protein
MHKITHLGLASAAVVLIVGSFASAASALPEDPAQNFVIGATNTSTYTDVFVDQACLDQLAPGLDDSICTITMETSATAPETVSAADLKADGTLRAANGQTLAEAAAAGTIKSRTWSQTQHSTIGSIAWSEKHSGRWYYDSHYAWVRTWHGKTGNHVCDQNSGIGVDFTPIACQEDGDHGGAIDNIDRYKTSAIWQGLHISVSHCMLTHTNGNGTLSKRQSCD